MSEQPRFWNSGSEAQHQRRSLPEANLWAAVIERSVRDFEENRLSQSDNSKRLCAELIQWASRKNLKVGSLKWICDNAFESGDCIFEKTRKELKRLSNGKERSSNHKLRASLGGHL